MRKTVDNAAQNHYNTKANASVAQSVVHLTRNEKVACSSHVTSSKIGIHLAMDADFLIQQKNCLHKPLISGAAQAVILVKLDGTNLLDRLEFV